MVAVAASLVRLVIGSALAGGLAGCALLDSGQPGGRGLRKAAAVAERLDRARDKAVAVGERAVSRNPSDPAWRSALGQAYLNAGRPNSAIGAFADAMALGDASPASIVGLALGRIALGEREAAVRLLDERQASVPASDRGLALALAGETARGVAVLADALRHGEDGARVRQNLAYAYALDGRWREAALMAAQDLPPDRVQARIEAWALLGRPEAVAERVGYVLGAPLRADPGYPAALALAPADAPRPSAELAAAPGP